MWFKRKLSRKSGLKHDNRRAVECCQHGTRYAAYVCQHLVRGSKLGFFTPDLVHITDSDENRDRCAWCSACEQVREEQKGWNDISEGAAGITMICDACFEASRLRNQT